MEPDCEKLANLMVEVVYPKLLDLMKHNSMKEVKIFFKGAKTIHFHDSGLLQWVGTDGHIANCSGYVAKKCPGFNNYGEKSAIDNDYGSANGMYVAHCNAIMNRIEELEKAQNIILGAINRASKIQLVYERKVLMEKMIN